MKNEERTIISKNSIIDAAIIEFAEKKYDGISLNQFCSKHGISKGKLYHHFDGKEQLFVACVEKCYSQFTETIKSFKSDPNVSYEENLHNYFQLRQDHFLMHPNGALVMYQAVQTAPASLKEPVNQIRSKFQVVNGEGLFEILKDVPLQRGVSINIIIKTFELASSYVHLVHGAPKWTVNCDNIAIVKDSLKIFDDVMQILLYGVLPREEI